MTDFYGTLGLEPGARHEEIKAAFEEMLEARRSRRQRTSDLHAAFAVVGDPTLRKAYDLARFGVETSERITEAKMAAVGFAQDVVADIDIRELAQQAREVVLKSIVLTSGVTARAAELMARVSRTVQVAASRQLRTES